VDVADPGVAGDAVEGAVDGMALQRDALGSMR
jgi:hypothetical protein